MKEEGKLTDFSWDEGIEFFGKTEAIDDTVQGVDFEEEEIKKPKKKEEEEEEHKKPEEQEEEERTEEKPTEEEEEEDKTKKRENPEKDEFFEHKTDEPGEEDEKFFNTLASSLKEAGVFQNVEIPEDEEIDEEKFIELQNNEVDARVEEAIEGFMEELDDDAKAFLKFKKEGGDTREFFKAVQQEVTLPKGDLEDENYQKKLIEYYYKTYEGMEDDEVSDLVTWLEDSGKLEKRAAATENKIQKKIQQQKEALIKQQEKQKLEQEKNNKKFIETLKKTVESTDEVNNIPITKKDKKELLNYITKPTVKVGKNKYLTAFQADMQNVMDDTEKLILIAKLVKDDFDLSDIIKKVETKSTVNLKKKLEKQKTNPIIKRSGSSARKSLSDYF